MSKHFTKSFEDSSYSERRFSSRKRHSALLPPPSVLQAYESMSPGSVNRLLDMAEREQKHRHEWEKNQLKAQIKTHRLGQFFSLVSMAAIVFGAIHLTRLGNTQTASYIAIGGFVTLILCALISARLKRLTRRPRQEEEGQANQREERKPRDQRDQRDQRDRTPRNY